jgi:DNA polymerase III subunit epsilon
LYAIVDIETTGGHASANGITEIAIHVHNGERVIKHFTTLINPQMRIPPFITALTGINNTMVANAPTFEAVAPQIFEILNDYIFVAHNVNFDYSFVFHHLKKYGYELNVKKLCTVRLARKALPGLASYSLGKLCRSLQINIDGRHRADGDAAATVKLFEKILDANGLDHIDKMLKRTSSEQWLPVNVDKKTITNLPPTAGVYYFHDAKGKIIYVGKAINIKKRVTSHFTHNDAGNRRQDFLRLVTNITYKECANELHALILESTEIKRLWPKYNRSQKQPMQKYGLYSFEDGRGYIRLLIDKKKKNIPAAYIFNMMHEGQVLLRNMIEEFELNHKLCHIDNQSLTENDLQYLDEAHIYNNKVKNALQQLKEQLPTFAIMDDGLNDNEKLCLLIENGCFWGMGYIKSKPQNIHTLKEIIEPYADNDFIRNSIYTYAEQNPDKKIILVND